MKIKTTDVPKKISDEELTRCFSNPKKYEMIEEYIDTESECKYTFQYFSGTYNLADTFHYHDYYEITFVTSKSALHLVNGIRQELVRGSLVFVRAGDVHVIMPCGENTSFINLTFSPNTLRQLFEYLSDGFPSNKLLSNKIPPQIIIPEKDISKLITKLEHLNQTNWSDSTGLKTTMRIIIADLFFKYFSDFGNEKDEDIPLWFDILCEKMVVPENFSEGTKQMEKISGKSRMQISRLVRKYYNMTISEFLNDLRLNYAANMLINSNIPIIDLCYKCGFQNISWFYTLFKEKFNITPKAYRTRK